MFSAKELDELVGVLDEQEKIADEKRKRAIDLRILGDVGNVQPERFDEMARNLGRERDPELPMVRHRPDLYSNPEQAKTEALARDIRESWLPPVAKEVVEGKALAGQDLLAGLARGAGVVSSEFDQAADVINRESDRYVAASAMARGEDTSGENLNFSFRRGLQGTVRSLIPTVAAGLSGGGIPGAIAVGSLIEGNQGITEARDAGLKGADVAKYAATQAVIEAGTEAAFAWMGKGAESYILGGKGEALKQWGWELLGENATEFGHQAERYISGVQDTDNVGKDLAQIAIDTTMQTTMTMGLGGGGRGIARWRQGKVFGKALSDPETLDAMYEGKTQAVDDLANIENPTRAALSEWAAKHSLPVPVMKEEDRQDLVTRAKETKAKWQDIAEKEARILAEAPKEKAPPPPPVNPQETVASPPQSTPTPTPAAERGAPIVKQPQQSFREPKPGEHLSADNPTSVPPPMQVPPEQSAQPESPNRIPFDAQVRIAEEVGIPIRVTDKQGAAPGMFKEGEAPSITLRHNIPLGRLLDQQEIPTGDPQAVDAAKIAMVQTLATRHNVPISAIGVNVYSKGGKDRATLSGYLSDPNYQGQVLGHELGHVDQYMTGKEMTPNSIIERVSRTKAITWSVFSQWRDKAFQKAARDELVNLTKEWSGDYDPTTPYGKYREKDSELVAEAVSVLFNNPSMLQDKAPTFWAMWQASLSTRPDLRSAYLEASAKLYSKDAATAESAKHWAKTQERGLKALQERFKDHDAIGWLDALRDSFKNRFAIIEDEIMANKSRGETIPEELDALLAISEARHATNRVQLMVDDIRTGMAEIFKKHNIDPTTYGLYLTARRVLGEPKVGGTINPGGMTLERAQAHMNSFEKAGKLEGYQQAADAHWAVREKFIAWLEKDGNFDEKLIEYIKGNKAYSKFADLEHFEEATRNLFGQSPLSSGPLKHRVGSAGAILDPFTATVLQDTSLIPSVMWNKAKVVSVDYYLAHHPDEIAKAVPDGNNWKPEDNGPKLNNAPGKRYDVLHIRRKGQMKSYMVPKRLADAFTAQMSDADKKMTSTIRAISAVPRLMFVGMSPAFQLFNLLCKDPWNTSRSLNQKQWYVLGLFSPRVLYHTFKNLPASYRAVMKGKLDETYRAMLEAEALPQQGRYDLLYDEARQNEELLGRVIPIGEKGKVITAAKETRKVFYDFLKIAEWNAKRVGWDILATDRPDMSIRERADFVRRYVGTPDVAISGHKTAWLNNAVLFSNVFIQGGAAQMELMKKQPGAYWWWNIKYVAAPKLAMFGLRAGFVGAFLGHFIKNPDDPLRRWAKNMEDFYKSYTVYQLGAYHIIPVGFMKGKTGVGIPVVLDESSNMLGSAIMAGLAGFFENPRGGISSDLEEGGRLMLEALGQKAPGMSPSIAFGQVIFEYLAGKPIVDPFTGRNVLTEEDQRASWDRTLSPVAQYLWQKMGGDAIYRFRENELPGMARELDETLSPAGYLPGVKAVADTMLQGRNVPGFGALFARALVVGSYGRAEHNKRVVEEFGRKGAERKMDIEETARTMARGEEPTLTPEQAKIAGTKAVSEKVDKLVKGNTGIDERDSLLEAYQYRDGWTAEPPGMDLIKKWVGWTTAKKPTDPLELEKYQEKISLAFQLRDKWKIPSRVWRRFAVGKSMPAARRNIARMRRAEKLPNAAQP